MKILCVLHAEYKQMGCIEACADKSNHLIKKILPHQDKRLLDASKSDFLVVLGDLQSPLKKDAATDISNRYICGKENTAKAVGVDSSTSMIRKADDFVSEMNFVNRDGEVIGVKGSFVEITGSVVVRRSGYYDEASQRHYLGIKELGNIYFTAREMEVFKRILQGWTAAKIANAMHLSPKTIETYIVYIRRKFGASTKSELITIAVQYGLTYML